MHPSPLTFRLVTQPHVHPVTKSRPYPYTMLIPDAYPLGDLSFADRVVYYAPGPDVGPPHDDPSKALGPPNIPTTIYSSVSLGQDGILILEFVDNLLVDQDDFENGLDLFIFESGGAVENFQVEISEDGVSWIDLGVVSGQPTGIDIKPFVNPGAQFRFVRLTDAPPNQSGYPYGQADINAVGAIGSIPAFSYGYDVEAIDPDDDPLWYSLPVHPAGMTIDAISGRISWNATVRDLGEHNVTVRVEDGRGGFDEQSFTIAVIGNRPPRIVSPPVTKAFLGQDYTYDVEAIDPDNDPLTYLLIDGPAGMTISADTGEITWFPPFEPSFSDDFEGSSLDPFWTKDEQSGYIAFPSTAQAHSGTQSVQFTSTNTGQHKDVRLYHEFSQPTYGRFSVWVYDTAAGSNNSNYSWIDLYGSGHRSAIFTDDWRGDVYRINCPEIHYTSVARSIGWHHWTIEVTPSAIRFAIDGINVYESLGESPPIEWVGIGIKAPSWRPTWTFYFDDFEFISYPPQVDVTVRVEDGRGGFDEQSFTIEVLDAVPGEIHGTKFQDPNADGVFDQDEPGLEGWIIYLDQNQNGQRDPGERWTTTDTQGHYSFNNLPPGTYFVAEQSQPGWVSTLPETTWHVVTIESGSIVTGIDFGNRLSDEPLPENRPPVFTSDPVLQVEQGLRYRYNASAYDPDRDTLSYDLLVRPEGMAVVASTGVVVWQPRTEQVGVHDVTLRVSDGRGGVDLQSFQITVSPANSVPVITSRPMGPAVAELPWQYQVRAQDADGDPITFSLVGPVGMEIDATTGLTTWTPSLLQADASHHVAITASDGRASTTQAFDLPVVASATNDPPQITSTPRGSIRLGGTYFYQIEAFDPNGDPLGYGLNVYPAGMEVDQNGLVRWVPEPDQLGPNPVEIVVSDGRGGLATQGWSINVVEQDTNRPPTIVSTPPLSGTVGRLYAYDAKATDPDGDPLTWSLDVFPAGMSIDALGGTVRWTPTDGQLGQNQVVVRVTDAQGAYATQSYTVTVRSVNLPPGITSVPPTQAYVDELYVYAVRATDPDSDLLQFSLTASPAGMTIDDRTGFIQWIPQSDQATSHDVTVLVTDGQGGSATQDYTVVVRDASSNGPPVITSDPVFVAEADQRYQYQVTAVDPDGDPIEYLLLENPDGMAIGAATGLIEWTPTLGQVGEHLVVVAAVDPLGSGGTQYYTLKVVEQNEPPTITSSPVTTVYAGLNYRYDVRATDPDGDPIRYSLLGPPGMVIDTLGRVSWSPRIADIGIHRIEITATDSHGAWIRQDYDLAVLADQQTPRVNLFVSANPVALGSLVTLAVTATDNVGVTAIGLKIDDQNVPLDAAGRITLRAEPAGQYSILAYASDAAGNTGTATTTLTVIDTSDQNAPHVAIVSPADNTVITAPVDVIGTVDDPEDNLVSYTVSAAPVGSDHFVTMFGGTTEVVNGTLGRFDPTGLANGTYRLRLAAVDTGGNTAMIENIIEVAGDLKIGNFRLSFTDLSIPVSGVPITVTRTYDSLTAAQQNDLGYGWRLEFRDVDLRTSVEPTSEFEQEVGIYNAFYEGARVYVTLPGGRRQSFTFRPTLAAGFAGSIFGFREPAFVPDAGVTSRLSVPIHTLMLNAYGEYYSPNGLPYNPADALNFGGVYYLTIEEGLLYQIDAKSGSLRIVRETNGHSLTFTDTSIDHSNGTRITFDRDPRGRIIAVTDLAGQKIRYQYDTKGDLVKVIDREGNATAFVYNEPRRPHFLTEVIDPLGRTGVRAEYDDQGRLVTLFDAEGNPVHLVHDPDNFTETITDAMGNSTVFEYDLRGNVVTEVDAMGGITRRTYDTRNNVLTQTDPLGHTTTYTYDAWGNTLSQTDALGNRTRYTYTTTVPGLFSGIRDPRPVSYLATTIDPLGSTTANTYDGAGNVLTTTDAVGNVTRYTYDSAGNQTSITDAVGHVTNFQYDGSGNVTKQIDALGNQTTFTYDANGNQLSETTIVTTPAGPRTLVTTKTYDTSGRPTSVTDAEGNTTLTEYDVLGNQTATIDALGRRTEFRYDDRGQLVGIDFADGTSMSMEYDVLGRRISSTDRAGHVTRYEYDGAGRLVTTIHPDDTPGDDSDNPRSQSEYDLAGRVIAQIDELGNRTEFEYDAAGRQTLTRDALGHETLTAYDGAGRRTSMTDALGNVTQFVYDAVGRLTTTTFADATSTLTTHDALGRVVGSTDQEGRATQFEYDALGRLTTVIDALEQRTEYQYDEQGNLIGQRDANGQETRFEYDGVGRRIATELPLGQRSTASYDVAGNVVAKTDFNQQTIIYQYDSNNRLLERHYPDGTSIAFTYSPTGQRETVVDARGVTTYEYDQRGRLSSRTDPDGSEIRYTYDAAGNRTSVTTSVAGNSPRTTDYTFDVLNRIDTVTDPEGAVTHYTYDTAGRLIGTELPNGIVETRVYNVVNRLTYLEHRDTASDQVIASFAYTLDRTGNRTAVEEHDGRYVAYDYDALYRLIGESIYDLGLDPATDPPSRTIGYTYDPVGNRMTRDDSEEGLTSYTYDENDRLLTEVAGGVATHFGYDANGNTISKTNATDQVFYHWDYENRLIAVDNDGDGTNDIEYQYNADGIKVSQTVDGEETRYLIDANRPYAQVLEEYTPGGVIKVSYVHGLNLISQNRHADTGKSFYHMDGLCSTRVLTNASGLVTDTYIYDAFGRTIGQIGSTGNLYLFAGEQRDHVTGLDYLRARWMNPAIGRFYGMDRFSGVLRNPVTLHRFLYANANPVNFVDPTGYFSLSEQMTTTAIMGKIHRSYALHLAKALRDTIIVTRFKLEPGADLQTTGLRMLSVGQERGYDLYVRGRALTASGFQELASTFNDRIVAIGNDLASLKDAFESAKEQELSLTSTILEKADFFNEMSKWLSAFAFLADKNENIRLRGHLDTLAAKSNTWSLVFRQVANSDLVKWLDGVEWPFNS